MHESNFLALGYFHWSVLILVGVEEFLELLIITFFLGHRSNKAITILGWLSFLFWFTFLLFLIDCDESSLSSLLSIRALNW